MTGRRTDPSPRSGRVVDNKEKPMGNIVLSFNETTIRDEGSFLNLTDMWRASGSDANKRPYEWLSQSSTVEFLECVGSIPAVAEDIKNMQESPKRFKTASGNTGKNHGLTVTLKGGADRGGVTWAHWQVAMAYAKYLSPAFHVWCNDVVRAYMQGQTAPAPDHRAMVAMAEQLERLTAEVIELRGLKVLSSGTIGKGRAESWIRLRIREIGKMQSAVTGENYKSLRGEIESNARFATSFFGAWETLPEHRLADVDRYLLTVERDILRQARRAHGFGKTGAKPGQLPLPLKLVKK